MSDYVLYVIEEDTDEGSDLMVRTDENGIGSPLAWTQREPAESMIREVSDATGCYGDMRVVELSVTARFPEPHHCAACGVWGTLADHAGHDD